MPPFNLSPSRIARFFYHECDRYLRYHATAAELRDREGVPEISWDASPVTAAILEGGYAWEEEIITGRLKKKVRVARGTGRLHERAHSVKASLNILRGLTGDEAVYQPTLKVPKNFYDRYGINPKLCDFPPCRPDLIQVAADGRLRIIDIKASSALKASHRIQVTLYALMLRDILKDQGLDLPLDMETGGVWLYGQDKPEWFDLGFSMGPVEQFLSQRLKDIFLPSPDETAWHLFYRCEWCNFFDHCRAEAENKQSVSLIPYLSVGGRGYLRKNGPHGGKPVHSLEDFKSLLSEDSADQILDGCGSLRGKKDRLINALTAMQNQEVILHGGSSLALPINESVRIMLTLHDDPVSGQIYAAGFRRFKGKTVYDGKAAVDAIFTAESLDACGQTQADFLKALFNELKILDDYNQGRPWREQKTLQAYVFDSFELKLFNRLLQDAAKKPELAPMALRLLFYFQDTALADEDEHPAEDVPFPVIVLTHVIRRLAALPAPISLRLPDAVNWLPSPDFTFYFDPSDIFWFDLSNTLKSDAIFNVWHHGHTEQLEWIHDELRRRLTAAHAVVDGLRDKAGERLFAWPPKFAFPGMLNFQNIELSRLAFIVRYESFMGAVKQREARTAPWPERVREGVSIPLCHAGGSRWELESFVDEALLDESNGFPRYLLVPAGEAGERAQMTYDDYKHRRSLVPSGQVRLAGIIGKEIDEASGRITHLHLKIKYQGDQTRFQTEDQAALHPRFTDFISDRIIDRLGELDIQPDNEFLRLLRDPAGFASVKKNIPAPALNIARKHAEFTPSQLDAFRHFLERRMTLVWGPPGTGKTHFLAKSILCMARLCQDEKRPLRAAVTAFTHAAIENLLEEIRTHMPAFGLEKSLSLFKLKEASTPRGRLLKCLGENDLCYEMDAGLLVAGGTVYSFHKADVEGSFPILIVDEASQMKFGELSLAMKPLARDGRMILAGDDLQLPPIIQGDYPDPQDGLPGLHDSVFAYFRARDAGPDPYTVQLHENWRMNAALSRFPALTLYGDNYKPVNPDVSRRKIRLKPSKKKRKSSEEIFCEWFLDPQWPLAVGVLEDVQAAVENQIEAELTALLSVYLRENLIPPGMKTAYPQNEKGDRAFWQHELFIVSPHHAQIRAIRKALRGRWQWAAPPFVDTVDKMQGQQCETVIASYGVSDAETALAEADFIYSLNRLNVSITRARSKCVVFLPRPLLEPSFDLLQNEKAVRGLGHMHALIAHCRRFGTEKSFDLNFLKQGGRLTAVRAGN